MEGTRVDFPPLTWSKLALRRLLGRECRSGLRKESRAEETELEVLWVKRNITILSHIY